MKNQPKFADEVTLDLFAFARNRQTCALLKGDDLFYQTRPNSPLHHDQRCPLHGKDRNGNVQAQ